MDSRFSPNMPAYSFATVIISALVFLAALGCFEVGRRFGIRRLRNDPEGGEGFGAIGATDFGCSRDIGFWAGKGETAELASPGSICFCFRLRSM